MAKDPLHLYGSGVFGEGLDPGFEGDWGAVRPPGNVGALAVEAARRSQAADEAEEGPANRRAPASLHRAIVALARSMRCTRRVLSRRRPALDCLRCPSTRPAYAEILVVSIGSRTRR